MRWMKFDFFFVWRRIDQNWVDKCYPLWGRARLFSIFFSSSYFLLNIKSYFFSFLPVSAGMSWKANNKKKGTRRRDSRERKCWAVSSNRGWNRIWRGRNHPEVVAARNPRPDTMAEEEEAQPPAMEVTKNCHQLIESLIRLPVSSILFQLSRCARQADEVTPDWSSAYKMISENINTRPPLRRQHLLRVIYANNNNIIRHGLVVRSCWPGIQRFHHRHQFNWATKIRPFHRRLHHLPP